ncbi:MAG: response regulator transcription factor, partial [Limisphaerales bacterium]
MNSLLNPSSGLNIGAAANQCSGVRTDTRSFQKADPMILIVAQHPATARRLVGIVRSAGYSATTIGSARELLNSPHLHPPCCVLLESNLTRDNGLDIQQELAQNFEFIPVIVLSEDSSVAVGIAAMKAGAVDYLVEPVDATVIADAIETALAKQLKNSEVIKRSVKYRRGWQTLTDRERQVLSFITNGYLNKQIAAKLGIAEKTVKVHRSRVMKKMQVASFAELVRLAER